MQAKTTKQQERGLIAVLRSAQAEAFDKDVACRRLAVIGTKAAVAPLAALLTDDHLCDVARHALEQIPDSAAARALRRALKKAKGRRLLGVINSIGNRRDKKAVGELRVLLRHNEADVVAEAARSLAKIGGSRAVGALLDALDEAPKPARRAIGEACVAAGDRLLESGEFDEARAVFDRVRKAQVAKPVRIAAARGAVLARGSRGDALLTELLKSEDRDEFEIALRIVREVSEADLASRVQAQAQGLSAGKRELLEKALRDRTRR